MNEYLQKLFETDFMPHGHCFFWKPDVLWLHVISDAIIALAYFSIPILLIYLVRKRKDLTFKYMFLLFGLFIFFCGSTHVMDIYTLWTPIYRVEGLVKAGTAFVSLLTGIMLIPMIPVALRIPSPEMLRVANFQLQQAKDELEDKVRERTAELSKYAEELKAEIARREIIQEQLEQTNSELKEFAYIVSHDLKSPIRAVGNLSDLLIIDYSDTLDDLGKENLSTIKQSAVRMENLINGILQYSRIGNKISEKEVIDLNIMVHEIFTELQAPDHINLHIENPLPVLKSEKVPIWQLFQNLIQNAIKFIDKPDGQIIINSKEMDDHYLFQVRDNGMGIDKAYHSQVFKIFQTLDTSDNRNTGIGLSIVQKIIKLYGGSIWIESEVGSFTAFNFTLPYNNVKM